MERCAGGPLPDRGGPAPAAARPSPRGSPGPACRFCQNILRSSFCDLGTSPLANAYLTAEQLQEPERFYPLHARVCDRCFLVQVAEFEAPGEIFGEYAYFSSYSDSWLRHARDYTDMAVERFRLGSESRVVEIASNDGYLLRNFVARGIPALGVEPAANVARVAREAGVPTLARWFGSELAGELVEEGWSAELVVGNNVLAHVPALNDFVRGLRLLLAPGGVATLEFPHLMRLIEENQFDTIYHEHFSYFSLTTVEKVFAAHALTVFDVEQLRTHGGSLRIYARHAESPGLPVTPAVAELRRAEEAFGLTRLSTYLGFEERARAVRWELLELLIRAKREGKQVVGYGAAAKGNTLLNYCGIRGDLLDYVVDRSPHKQGRFLPGSRIPVHAPERISETKPDYVLVLPWNLREEITAQMAHVREWGGRFVVPIPRVRVL